MQDAKILNQQEVREIIAEYFGIPVSNVINSKYSYIVIGTSEKEADSEKDN